MANHNPYAPPLAESTPHETPAGVSDYRGERRSVLLAVVLTVITAGLYPAIWLIRRRAFLNKLDASEKVTPSLLYVILAVQAIALVLALVGDEAAQASRGLDGAAGIFLLLASFRVANILSSDIARTGRLLPVSRVWTFFFNVFYLQHKMNQLAGIPARLPRRA